MISQRLFKLTTSPDTPLMFPPLPTTSVLTPSCGSFRGIYLVWNSWILDSLTAMLLYCVMVRPVASAFCASSFSPPSVRWPSLYFPLCLSKLLSQTKILRNVTDVWLVGIDKSYPVLAFCQFCLALDKQPAFGSEHVNFFNDRTQTCISTFVHRAAFFQNLTLVLVTSMSPSWENLLFQWFPLHPHLHPQVYSMTQTIPLRDA